MDNVNEEVQKPLPVSRIMDAIYAKINEVDDKKHDLVCAIKDRLDGMVSEVYQMVAAVDKYPEVLEKNWYGMSKCADGLEVALEKFQSIMNPEYIMTEEEDGIYMKYHKGFVVKTAAGAAIKKHFKPGCLGIGKFLKPSEIIDVLKSAGVDANMCRNGIEHDLLGSGYSKQKLWCGKKWTCPSCDVAGKRRVGCNSNKIGYWVRRVGGDKVLTAGDSGTGDRFVVGTAEDSGSGDRVLVGTASDAAIKKHFVPCVSGAVGGVFLRVSEVIDILKSVGVDAKMYSTGVGRELKGNGYMKQRLNCGKHWTCSGCTVAGKRRVGCKSNKMGYWLRRVGGDKVLTAEERGTGYRFVVGTASGAAAIKKHFVPCASGAVGGEFLNVGGVIDILKKSGVVASMTTITIGRALKAAGYITEQLTCTKKWVCVDCTSAGVRDPGCKSKKRGVWLRRVGGVNVLSAEERGSGDRVVDTTLGVSIKKHFVPGGVEGEFLYAGEVIDILKKSGEVATMSTIAIGRALKAAGYITQQMRCGKKWVCDSCTRAGARVPSCNSKKKAYWLRRVTGANVAAEKSNQC